MRKISFKTSQGRVEVDFGESIGYCVSLSGGIDSAIALYCLVKAMDDDYDYKPIYAITTMNRTDKACGYHAQLIIDWIKRKFPKVEIDHFITSTILDGTSKSKIANEYCFKLFKKKKIDVWIDGVTRNPKDNSFKYIDHEDPFSVASENFRNEKLEMYKQLYEYPADKKGTGPIRIRPWANIDKKGLYEISQKLNITGRIIILTKSCTHRKKYKCGICWWCQERKWAFND